MIGAINAVTFPIRPMPPRMTAATTANVNAPVTNCGMASESNIWSATVFACTALPTVNAVKTSMPAKKMAIGFHLGPRPFSM